MRLTRFCLATLPAATLLLAAAAAQAQPSNYAGIAVGAIPEYEGSSTYRALPVPVISYHSGSFFITPRAGLPALGLKTQLATDLEAGVFVGLSLGRKASRTERTKGLDNIDFHGAYGVYAEWSPGPFSLGAAYRQAAHSGYGGTLDLRATYEAWKSGPHRVTLGAGTQWASHSSMQTWFGISDSQAAQSQAGLREYSPSAGFKSASLFGVWSYHLSGNWSALSTIGVNRLIGDAKDSPLTAEKTNIFGSVGVIYAF